LHSPLGKPSTLSTLHDGLKNNLQVPVEFYGDCVVPSSTSAVSGEGTMTKLVKSVFFSAKLAH
jgi:hypothetical protein